MRHALKSNVEEHFAAGLRSLRRRLDFLIAAWEFGAQRGSPVL